MVAVLLIARPTKHNCVCKLREVFKWLKAAGIRLKEEKDPIDFSHALCLEPLTWVQIQSPIEAIHKIF